ncbi:MAG TPA: hypothetical protein VK843_18525 [Planctomycetota bacterium]|nr:hypothetical protein [Planctomycetota bacterium]
MPAPRPSLCITCGLDAGPSNHLNRMEDGRTCPTCRERLLASLPPPFPGFAHLPHSPLGGAPSRAIASVESELAGIKKARRGNKGESK